MLSRQTDRTWQYGQAAATLLVAYMFVLQGIAAGLAAGPTYARGPGESICLTVRSSPLGGKPAGPSRDEHGAGACCIQHCSGLDNGVVAGAPDVVLAAPRLAATLSPLSAPDIGLFRGSLPVGARAPPSIVV
jgi:hypothetical protein